MYSSSKKTFYTVVETQTSKQFRQVGQIGPNGEVNMYVQGSSNMGTHLYMPEEQV